MKQDVRVIKTQRAYDAAIARLSSLMDEDFAPGSSKEAELELLALVIESYERSKVSPVSPDPVEAILFRMDQQGLKKKDLIPYIGSLPKVSEVISRKRPLSLSMIRRLHKGLGIPAEVLISGSEDEGIDLAAEPQYNYAKFPLQEMWERGCFPDFAGGVKQVRDYAEDLVRKFLRGVHEERGHLALLRAPLHQSGSRIMDEYALLVWRISVLRKARNLKLSTPYREDTITDVWLRDLAKLSRFEQGPRLAQEYLTDHGIALVVERHFAKTYLDGAAMLDDHTPIVALTLRHDRLDNFWFALMHELIHIQRHLKASHLFIADNLDDKTRSSTEEHEADRLARDALIPVSEWERAAVRTVPTVENTVALADHLRIHPAIVAGRVRYESNNWRLLTGLLGEKGVVAKCFNDQIGGPQDQPNQSKLDRPKGQSK